MREPSKTVKTGSVAGAITIVIVWIFGGIFPNVYFPPEVSAAITLIITAAAAWIVPDPGRRPAKH